MESGLLFSVKIVFWLTETDSPQPVSHLPPLDVLVLVDHVLCDSVLCFNEAFVMPGRLPLGQFHQDLAELFVKHDLLYGYNSTRSLTGY